MGEPLPICFLNGDFLPLREARISPLDRGFLYSDGAYEVTPVYGGRPFRFAQHHDRLTRSLQEIRMDDPLAREAWRERVSRADRPQRRSRGRSLYICAGDARRRVRPQPRAAARCAAHGVRVRLALAHGARRAGCENGLPAVTADDTRWARCDIKSVSLLANVLLRQLAVDENATETILLRDGQLTDASASSVHVVIGGELRTPPNSWKLLPGTTRGVIEEIAEQAGVKWRSAPVSEAELRSAVGNPAGRGDARSAAGHHARRQAGRQRQTRPGVAQALRCLPGVQARSRGDAVVEGHLRATERGTAEVPGGLSHQGGGPAQRHAARQYRRHRARARARSRRRSDHRAREQPAAFPRRSPTPSTRRAANRSSRSPMRCRRAKT